MSNRILNWKRQPKDDRDLKSIRHTKAIGPLPEEFQVPAQIPVYDQLDEGSCTANGGCISFRFEYFQKTGHFNFEPSRQYLYYNTRDLEGTTAEDAGAYVRDVFKAINKFGLCSEKIWPYSKKLTTKPIATAYVDGEKNKVVTYGYVAQDLKTIKETLYDGACVLFGFDVYQSFEDGNWDSTTGIMPIPDPKKEDSLGGHCVTIIGWSDSRKCFLIQNSWGTSWGQQGKFWMPYSYALDKNHCDDFWCIQDIYTIDAIVTDVVEPIPDPIVPIPIPDDVKVNPWIIIGAIIVIALSIGLYCWLK